LQETSFFIFMCVGESSAKAKAKRVESLLTCISNTINNFLDDILTNELPKHLFPSYQDVDHKMKMVLRSAPTSKLPY
jgi:hypothetical protein